MWLEAVEEQPVNPIAQMCITWRVTPRVRRPWHRMFLQVALLRRLFAMMAWCTLVFQKERGIYKPPR